MHTTPTIYILPGAAGQGTQFWYQWLQEELQQRGYRVRVCGQHVLSPDVRAKRLNKKYILTKYDSIIGHSFGGLTALKWVEYARVPIHGLVLVDVSTHHSFTEVPSALLATLDAKQRVRMKAIQRRYFHSWNWKMDLDDIARYVQEAVVLSERGTGRFFPTWHADHEYIARKLGAEVVITTGKKQHYTAQKEPDVLAHVLRIALKKHTPDKGSVL